MIYGLLGKSEFFYQDRKELNKRRVNLITHLKWLGYNEDKIAVYLIAWDYYVRNPKGFDGATASEDSTLEPIGVDYRAVLHDYFYEVHKVYCNKKYLSTVNDFYLSEIENYSECTASYLANQKRKLFSIVEKFYLWYAKLKGVEVKEEEKLVELLKKLQIWGQDLK